MEPPMHDGRHDARPPHGSHESHGPRGTGHYGRLLLMAVLSFVAMYALMYAMVDTPGNVFHNLNQVYMAGLMAAPMVVIELVLMARMYPRRALNAGLAAASAVLMLLCWFGIRRQAAIDDRQFLRSMIPHHAGAVLMCERNRLEDPVLQRLCRQIVASQQAEIALMKSQLERGPTP